MSRTQRQELDARLRHAPQPSAPATIEEMRAGFAALMATFPVRADVTRTPATLAERPAVIVEPAARAAGPGTILYFHGGSFALGSPDTAMALTADLVARAGVRAISLDYRLAPEHPFPAAIEDCVRAYGALLEGGSDASQILFAGDSAGGGLSVTTCLAARDAGLPMPAGVVAFSPGLDHTRTGTSMRTKEEADPFFTMAGMEQTGRLYLAGQDPRQPLLAPSVLADLSGLPPLLLQVGTHEMLLDDAVRLAERARAAEVDVILDVTAGVQHVFQAYAGTIDEADQALDRAALFIRQRLASGA
ncbi:MAG: alpha/beta hydrolase [Nocardioides sp.]